MLHTDNSIVSSAHSCYSIPPLHAHLSTNTPIPNPLSIHVSPTVLSGPTDRRIAAEASLRVTQSRSTSGARTVPYGSSAFFRPRAPFKLAAFNVRTLARIGQQAALARTMESLAIDVCCLSETRIYDSSSVKRLSAPSNSSRSYYLRLSGDDEAAESGQAGVGIVLSSIAEASLLEWIPVDSRLCAVRLKGSCRRSRLREETRNLFVIAAYAPTDCSSDAVKDGFYQRLHDLLRTIPRSDVVILAGDLNARVGRLSADESHLGGCFGLECSRSDNGERLLSLCSEHRLFLSSTNFKHSKRRSATWRPPSPAISWGQLDHIAISYSWRGCVQDCRSYWSTCLDSDHALVCARLSMRFGGHPHRKHGRLNVAKLSQPAVLNEFQDELASELATIPQNNVDEHWNGIRQSMQSAGLKSCGLTQRRVKHWVSGVSLQLMACAAKFGYQLEERPRNLVE